MRIDHAKNFVANYSYLFRYSGAIHPCCAEARGREVARDCVSGLVCKFISACAKSACLKPMTQAACNDFNKRMNRHGPGVSTRFCGLHHVRLSGGQPINRAKKIMEQG
jgi:hypothetical protein